MPDDPPTDEPALRPARPDAPGEGRAAFGPRIPWKWIILGVVGIGAVFASYFVRRDARKEALRDQMVVLHETQLTEVSERYLAFRQRIEGYVQTAHEAGEPEEYVDPRLNIAGLRSGEGLYLRVPADFAVDQEHIESAALQMVPDAIGRCLGLAPVSVRGLYEKGYFLTPEWVDNLREEQDMMALRVLDDQLGRHVQVDVPVVLSMLQADWFMLVIQQGESRRNDPVDVYLWDLTRNQQLLRTRIQGRGLLIPVRMRFDGVNNARAPGAPSATSGAATDCSIASQIRALTGSEPVNFESGEAVIDAAERAAEEAAAREAEAAAARGEEGAEGAPAEEAGEDTPGDPDRAEASADGEEASAPSE
ncbi:MAG: hypothetical protein AB8I08_38595 [Sandaracinaceae bacterium]